MPSPFDENGLTIDFLWMDMLRAIAISGVIFHNWFQLLSHQCSLPIFSNVIKIIQSSAGTLLHLFFILSGCGLTMSYFRRGKETWIKWAGSRVRKIVLPFWIIVFFNFLLANLAHNIAPEFIKTHYGWYSLFSYFTFTRNFYKAGWSMNLAFWFMPVIIVLYILFPILIKIVEKYGILALLIISTLVSYLSITVCILIGYTVSNQSGLPLFYISEFAFGMFIGHILYFRKNEFKHFVNFKMFILGIGSYCFSWIIQRSWTLGSAYNDLFTGIGVYLIFLYVCKWLIRFSPQKSVKLLTQLSKESYIMYLIHVPLVVFVIKPILMYTLKSSVNSFIMIIFSLIYCIVIYFLARFVSKPINRLASFISSFCFCP